MRTLLVLFLALVAPAALRAQDAVMVKSGEHGTFSRLVFYFSDDAPINLGRTDDGYAVRATGKRDKFDIESVFTFMPRSRIVELKEMHGGLAINVDCDCHANGFEYRPGIYVIDIKNGAAPQGSPFEQAMASWGAAKPEFTMQATANGMLPSLVQRTLGLAPQTEEQIAQLAEESLVPTINLEAFQQALSEDLSRAVAGGLLAANAPPAGEQQKLFGAAKDQSLAAPQAASFDGTGARQPVSRLNLAFEDMSGSGTGRLTLGSDCLPAEWFAPGEWGGAGSAEHALSSARATFMSDLAIPDDDAVVRLARTYISLGFGAEAANVLQQYPQGTRETTMLLAIARQVDMPREQGPNYLRQQIACDTGAALWALLAFGGEDPGGDLNAKAVVRSLSAMPLHLRRHLAPVVSQRLRAYGDEQASQSARDTVLRADDSPDSSMSVEISHAAEEVGADVSLLELQEAAAQSSEAAPAATAQLIRTLRKQERLVSEELLESAAAQIHAHRGTPQAAELFLAYLESLQGLGRYLAALDYIEKQAQAEGSEVYDLETAVNGVLQAVARDADDGSFALIATTRLNDDLPAAPTDKTLQAIAERLIKLGFADMAMGLIPTESLEAGMHRRIMMAEAALARGEPMEALARVANREEPEAIMIRARALALAGAHTEAAKIYEALGQDAEATDAMWLASDWEQTAQREVDSDRSRLAEMLSKVMPAAVPEDAANAQTQAQQVEAQTLAERRQMLAQSAELRVLLERFALNQEN